jgi:molecular chaperone GrpE
MNDENARESGPASPADPAPEEPRDGADPGAPRGDGTPPPGSGGYSWEMRYRAAQAKADEHFSNWQRAAADIANLRRQTQRERDEVVAYARAAMIADLLPVLDHMERFIATAPPFVADDNWVRGISLLDRQVRRLLESQGLQPIPCRPNEEQVDASRHHPMIHRGQTGHPDGTILAELQRGYTLGGQVLRPTFVAVAREDPRVPPLQDGGASTPAEPLE